MNTFIGFLAAAIVGTALAQVHLGPIGDPVGANGGALIDCYTCDDAHHGLPGCLDKVHQCHADQVCSISYGNGDGHAVIHCKPKHECQEATAHPLRNCTAGGVEIQNPVHHGPHHEHDRDYACMKCCEDTACVSELANLIKIEAMTSANLMCPGTCNLGDMQTCMDKAHQCGQDQYCKIEKDEWETWGECHDDHDYNHCLDEVNGDRGCTGNHHGPHHGPEAHCFLGCCTSGDCVMGALGLTTMAPATTSMMPTTTMMPTMAPTTMAATMAPTMAPTTMAATMAPTMAPTTGMPATTVSSCVDNLSGLGCNELTDVCSTVLAASVCPKFCGLCQ